MKVSETDFYFMPFSELKPSHNVPVLTYLFEDQSDLVVAQHLPELEELRLRADKTNSRASEAVTLVPIRRNEQAYMAGMVYISYPWRKSKRWDPGAINFNRKVTERTIAAVSLLRKMGFTEAVILLPGRFHPENIKSITQKNQLLVFVQTIAEAIIYANKTLDDFKNFKADKEVSKITFTYFGEYNRAVDGFFQKALSEGENVGQALAYTRRLIEMPPNLKRPLSLVELATGVSLKKQRPRAGSAWRKLKEHRFSSQVRVSLLYGTDAIRNFGFGLVAAIGQGSVDEPCFLKLHYKPKTKRQRRIQKIVLTGKGVTFDTGGVDLKGGGEYTRMHYDMAGAANVLGLIKLADTSNAKVELIGLLPIVHNAISAKAIEPHSVVRAYDGKTVEIINTDSEGRLILGDAVAYSEKTIRPDCTISVATLVDIEDLVPDVLKVFVTNRGLEKKVRRAEHAASEKVMLWPFPDYLNIVDKDLEGDHTDLVNDLPYGYHTASFMFIYNFLKSDSNWVFVDVSAVFVEDAHDYAAGPGFGLKFLWHLVKQFE